MQQRMTYQAPLRRDLDSEAPRQPETLPDLIALAVALGARGVEGWSEREEALAAELPTVDPRTLASFSRAIAQGQDPLGEAFCRLTPAAERRPAGATYTPYPIVDTMLKWAAAQCDPDRVIDPGAGSARFLVAAGRIFPKADLWAVESDPLAAILACGHLAAAGQAGRARVLIRDYREAALPAIAGKTLFAGNPPYVRHHLIAPYWKRWLVNTARKYGLAASQLAGLHAHFFLATAEYARPGDIGVLITAAEWLDVNYGRLVRDLLLDVLGVKHIHLIEPTALPFPDAATTAVITAFEVGSRAPEISLRRVSTRENLSALSTAVPVSRERLASASRWTPLTRPGAEKPAGFIELGELFSVHRGQVTGANRVWIAGPHSGDLPECVLFPAVTKARELFAIKGLLIDVSELRRIIDLPVDLDVFDGVERQQIERFLGKARAMGADTGYVARQRKAWWAVGLRAPAPILATYMARRPPAFVRNLGGARHINIAHGLYPREPLPDAVLRALAHYLACNTTLVEGRTYAGGLTKFEPREMERLLIPRPELLLSGEWTLAAV